MGTSGGREGLAIAQNKLEITLRITLDRNGLAKRLKREIGPDQAFYVLGLVHAQLTSQFGEENCLVDLAEATGVSPSLAHAMNHFTRRYKRALDQLGSLGETYVEDRDLLDTLLMLHQVEVVPYRQGWRVSRRTKAPSSSVH